MERAGFRHRPHQLLEQSQIVEQGHPQGRWVQLYALLELSFQPPQNSCCKTYQEWQFVEELWMLVPSAMALTQRVLVAE